MYLCIYSCTYVSGYVHVSIPSYTKIEKYLGKSKTDRVTIKKTVVAIWQEVSDDTGQHM